MPRSISPPSASKKGVKTAARGAGGRGENSGDNLAEVAAANPDDSNSASSRRGGDGGDDRVVGGIVGRGHFFAESSDRVICHCWAMESRVLTSQ